jgi:hypothetical protein
MRYYQPLPARPRSPKSVFLAIFLQGSPLLTVIGCLNNTINLRALLEPTNLRVNLNQDLFSLTCEVGAFLGWMLWGLGYAYLGEWKQFAGAFFGGPVLFVASSITTLMFGVCGFEGRGGDPNLCQHASLAPAFIIAIATLLIIIDTWRRSVWNNVRAKTGWQNGNWSIRSPASQAELDELILANYLGRSETGR